MNKRTNLNRRQRGELECRIAAGEGTDDLAAAFAMSGSNVCTHRRRVLRGHGVEVLSGRRYDPAKVPGLIRRAKAAARRANGAAQKGIEDFAESAPVQRIAPSVHPAAIKAVDLEAENARLRAALAALIGGAS